MTNPTGTNQFGAYDLERVRRALEGWEWEAALRPFHYVRMATVGQIEATTGLPRRRVFALLKTLADYEEEVPPGATPQQAATIQLRRILTRHSVKVAHRAEVDTRETVFLLGSLGAALLRDLGLLNDPRGSQERRVTSQAHSLCILDLMLRAEADAVAGLRAEKLLPNAGRLTLRADVAVPQFSDGAEPAARKVTGWHAIDVEQIASERNASRLELQVERWQAFFAGRPAAEPVVPRLLLLFNVQPADLDVTLSEWQNALAVVAARRGPLTFTVRCELLADFVESPVWDPAQWTQLRALEPVRHTATPAEAQSGPLEADPSPANLYGLCERALAIYALSRGESDPLARCRRPVASLRALQEWLESPEMASSRERLCQALGKLNGRWPPAHILFVLNKMLWEALLQPFGLDRNHIGPLGVFQAAFVGPAISDLNAAIYGDYHVRIRLAANLAEMIRGAGVVNQYHGENTLSNALEWMLGAPYTYAYELGLRDQPWLASESHTKKKGGKRD